MNFGDLQRTYQTMSAVRGYHVVLQILDPYVLRGKTGQYIWTQKFMTVSQAYVYENFGFRLARIYAIPVFLICYGIAGVVYMAVTCGTVFLCLGWFNSKPTFVLDDQELHKKIKQICWHYGTADVSVCKDDVPTNLYQRILKYVLEHDVVVRTSWLQWHDQYAYIAEYKRVSHHGSSGADTDKQRPGFRQRHRHLGASDDDGVYDPSSSSDDDGSGGDYMGIDRTLGRRATRAARNYDPFESLKVNVISDDEDQPVVVRPSSIKEKLERLKDNEAAILALEQKISALAIVTPDEEPVEPIDLELKAQEEKLSKLYDTLASELGESKTPPPIPPKPTSVKKKAKAPIPPSKAQTEANDKVIRELKSQIKKQNEQRSVEAKLAKQDKEISRLRKELTSTKKVTPKAPERTYLEAARASRTALKKADAHEAELSKDPATKRQLAKSRSDKAEANKEILRVMKPGQEQATYSPGLPVNLIRGVVTIRSDFMEDGVVKTKMGRGYVSGEHIFTCAHIFPEKCFNSRVENSEKSYDIRSVDFYEGMDFATLANPGFKSGTKTTVKAVEGRKLLLLDQNDILQTGEMLKVQEGGTFVHSCSTDNGDSGTPIFQEFGKTFALVGVHTGKGGFKSNSGVSFPKRFLQ